jgi:hypothetical protein
MEENKKEVAAMRRKRDDLSTFLVHLTRNTENARTAKENLIDIICGRVIEPRNAKGLFYSVDEVRHQVKSVCFNETPLSYIKHTIGKLHGRDIELSPYGLVFSKDFLIHKGANPIFYVNTYNNQNRKQVLIDTIRQLDVSQQKEIAPYIDIFGWTSAGGGIYDFHWEHEWRYLGNFEFEWKDIVFGLCEDEYIDELEQLFEKEIRFISPFMSLEEIVGRLVLNREETKYLNYTEHFETA